MLRASYKEAGPEARLFTGSEFESVLRMLERKMVGLPMFTFIDEARPELLPRIKKLAKEYSDEYVLTVVVEAMP